MYRRGVQRSNWLLIKQRCSQIVIVSPVTDMQMLRWIETEAAGSQRAARKWGGEVTAIGYGFNSRARGAIAGKNG